MDVRDSNSQGRGRGRKRGLTSGRPGNSKGVSGNTNAKLNGNGPVPLLSASTRRAGQDGGRGRKGKNRGGGESVQHNTFQHGDGVSSVRKVSGAKSHGQDPFFTHFPSDLSAEKMLEFLQSAVLQVTTGAASRESFIKSLASERGLTTVRRIVETDFASSYSVTRPIFRPHCVLFLRLVADEAVMTSLVLEQAVGTIYNVIYGLDGKRAIRFFTMVASCMEHGKPAAIDTEFAEALKFASKALEYLLTVNQGAIIKKEFHYIVEKIGCCYKEEDVRDNRDMRTAHEHIMKIKDLLSIGDSIPISKINPTSQDRKGNGHVKTAPAKEEGPVDFPGELSELGPRHDNDHAMVSDISILPTVSEIICTERPDFLPSRGKSQTPQHHQFGLQRLFDSQFRLLREDTSGLVRDSIRLILSNWEMIAWEEGNWKAKRKLLRDESPTPVRIYSNAKVQHLRRDGRWGLEVDVEFDQLHRLKHCSPPKREHWWRTSRELREGGAVVAIMGQHEDGKFDIVFTVVSKRNLTAQAMDRDEGQAQGGGLPKPKIVSSLAGDASRAAITLRPASLNSDASNSCLLRLASQAASIFSSPYLLVEFPAVRFRSFDGVLRCLQSLHKNPSTMPFSAWLVPRQLEGVTTVANEAANSATVIPPPSYLSNSTLDLSCMISAINEDNNDTSQPLSFSMGHDPHVLASQLAERTMLDPGQAVAMVSALRHEVALIQGPPGTGKSFVGIQIAKCLLQNRHSFDMGPLVCICYTDHALDQFLEELLDLGVKDVIRIGAKTFSARLEALSLDSVRKSTPKLKGLGKQISQHRTLLAALEAQIGAVCELSAKGVRHIIASYLKKTYPAKLTSILSFPTGDPLSDWETGDGPGDLYTTAGSRGVEQLLQVDVWTLTRSERETLFQHWRERALTEFCEEFAALMRAFSSTKQQLTAVFNQSDPQVLQNAHVLGITTTQFANNSDLLRGIKAKVLICEEAAEVLESHVLTALVPSVQHLILIGDHLQLRPKISNLKLSKERARPGARYNLDESLFERLANVRLTSSGITECEENADKSDMFPIAQLDHQRRMHPSISMLIRDTLYPHLKDHPNTSLYPEVSGMKHRLFWLDHKNFEDASDPNEPMQSKTNTWEAEMVTALVRHLCRQGIYKPGEIAVLTPYIAQLSLLTEMLGEVAELLINEKDLEDLYDSDKEAGLESRTNRGSGNQQRRKQKKVEKGRLLDRIRMATVDNFQGEEATVIVISLVRSNERNICGFLKSPNRINVLLSRAKHGMYIIGNARTSAPVSMWKTVLGIMEENRNIGNKLQLQCSRHPDNQVFVKSPEDFAIYSPEGGCNANCDDRLECGHSCSVKCHSTVLHKLVQCMKNCPRARECGHVCKKKCSDDCGECREIIPNVGLPCGHTVAIECAKLSEVKAVKCHTVVTKTFPSCGHGVRLPCYSDINSLKCRHACESLLPCGHSCQRNCSDCRKIGSDGHGETDHGSCVAICGRGFTMCSHSCSDTCHPEAPCKPCRRPCEVRCQHSKCRNKCCDPCAPCAEACGWGCNHRSEQCSLPCAAPCNIFPCDERCSETLSCGHRCSGLCGERCPRKEFCHECGKPELLERTVDFLTFETYGETNVDEDPLIFLPCGHFYTKSTLDGVMGLREYYKLKRRVAVTGEAVKGCPECRTPIRDIGRYNRVIKTALLDEATRRFVAQASSWSAEILDLVQNFEDKLEEEKSLFISQWAKGNTEYKNEAAVKAGCDAYNEAGHRLLRAIKNYANFVSKAEQPFGKVNSMIAAARTRHGHQNEALDDSMIQTGFVFRCACLRFRATWSILWHIDTIAGNASVDKRVRDVLRDYIDRKMERLISGAEKVQTASKNAKLTQYYVEASMYQALFSILRLNNTREQGQEVDAQKEASIRERERQRLDECDEQIANHPGTLAHLRDKLESAKRLVIGGTFYSTVTTEEKRNVYRAMAAEFSGTGHWYYCQNNHPFTVGECGMPMQEARCPECGAPVGGHDHVSVAGVSLATDIEVHHGT